MALTPEELSAVVGIVGDEVVGDEVVWERRHVVRVELAAGGTAIVKRPRRDRDPKATSEDAARIFAGERASLQLLREAGVDAAPRLLGVCDDPTLLVMEDLPPGRALADVLLLGDDPMATRVAIVALAEALASMHAATAGREERYRELLGRDPDRRFGWRHWSGEGVGPLVALAADRGLATAAARRAAEAECAIVVDELDGPGWWRTFVHSDPCPDNTRIEDGPSGRFRVFDFEFSGFGHALVDASYVVAPFPSCWCFGRIPEHVSAAAIGAYRRVLASTLPEAADDAAWNDALTVALAAPVLARAESLAKVVDADQRWGTAGMRVRLRRWIDAFRAQAATSGRFPALLELTDALAADLAVRWPDDGLPDDYPALPTGADRPVVTPPEFWRPGL